MLTGVPEPRRRAPGEPLRIVFVGQTVERKGLPVLLRAFEALRGQVPAELTIVGATQEEIAPLLVDAAGVTALGRVDDAARRQALHDADLLCAPSLGGESFGMVLTEAFAAGRPVVASDIAGYRDVVTHGADGLLVPRGDATRLAETLRDLALDRERTTRARRRGRPQRRALRLAARGRAGRRTPTRTPAPCRRRRARRSAPPSASGRCPPTAGRARPRAGCGRWTRRPPPEATARFRIARRLAVAAAMAGAAAGTLLALERIGMRPIAQALVESQPVWVLVGLALMCALDARPRRRLARDPARGAARRAAAARRLRAGDDDRRADVRDPAGQARRAVARPDRGAAARPAARAPARRARHAGLADAAQRARAGDPRRRDVHHDRPVRRPPAGARLVRAGAVRRALRGPRRARRCCARASRPARPACTAG